GRSSFGPRGDEAGRAFCIDRPFSCGGGYLPGIRGVGVSPGGIRRGIGGAGRGGGGGGGRAGGACRGGARPRRCGPRGGGGGRAERRSATTPTPNLPPNRRCRRRPCTRVRWPATG